MRELCVGVLKGYKKPAPKRSVPIPRVVEPAAKAQPPSGSPSAKALTAAAGVAAVLCTAAYYPLHPSILKLSRGLGIFKDPKGLQTAHGLSHLGITGGFPAGFLAASALTAIFAAASLRQLSKLTQIHSGFTQYPPHKPSTKRRIRSSANERPFLNPQTYQRLPLIRKDTLARGVLRLFFALPTPTTTLGLPTGQHVSIRAVIDGKPVSRSYTPVSNDSDKGVLELVVRVYPDGQLTSRYLARLRDGGVDSVEFRGPKGAMRYHRGWAKRIGMVAGGTGITPMYQVVRAICEDPEDETEVSLVYANRREEDILLREDLEALAARCPGKLSIWYMLDIAPEGWAYGAGFVSREVVQDRMPQPGEGSKVMLCGPPGMVNAVKGLLTDMGYKAPGPAGKMEDDIFVF
ncbi:ferredoxin reductase-like protein [Parathielavia appendiculata]|uniref:Ferredoxin reductase-like protein n=1 Tax=Parathielavia appendiculata TaxID=2587402 RepID=A0AAN6TSJ9_9PEZI|nr:ferredoxin reductase-like protein [Parathielavia appendiculata]